VSNLSHELRVALVERDSHELPLTQQADLLSVSRSGLYYQPREPSAEEIAVKHRIDEIYTQSPFYGSRKIEVQLRREGVVINRKTVLRHMREMGIVAIDPGPNLSRRQHKEHVFPSLTECDVWGSQSGVGHRYHVYSDAERMDVSGGHFRLVFALCDQLSNYFEFYNQKRLHQSLNYRTPAEVYATGQTIRE